MSFLLLCARTLPAVAQQARLDTNRSTDLIVLLSLSLIFNAPLLAAGYFRLYSVQLEYCVYGSSKAQHASAVDSSRQSSYWLDIL